MSFVKISKRAQFYLLGLFLNERLIHSDFQEEINNELLEEGYLNPDLTVSKKGEAYCHTQNYTGTNFKTLVNNNTKKANTALACELLSHISDSGPRDLKYLSKILPSEVKTNIIKFLESSYEKAA